MLKGSRVEIYRIAALLNGGMSRRRSRGLSLSVTGRSRGGEGICGGSPKAGRPYPRTTAKRALKDGGLEALDEVLDER